ncbi:MAG: glycerophosphodiester phosphodiesterase family protein [Patescibacteria group bacterium]
MIRLAHRGCYSRKITENTLEALEEAVMRGADGIEFDLHLSKDGEIMVVHDADLHRLAGYARKIRELESAELISMPLRYGGSIPTLNDVTARIHAPALLDMEVKTRAVLEPLLKKLSTSTALRERTIISSFNAQVLKEVRRHFPEMRTLFLIKRWPLPLRRKKVWNKIKDVNPWGVAFPIISLTRKRVIFLRGLCANVGGWDLRGLKRESERARKLELDVAIVRITK